MKLGKLLLKARWGSVSEAGAEAEWSQDWEYFVYVIPGREAGGLMLAECPTPGLVPPSVIHSDFLRE